MSRFFKITATAVAAVVLSAAQARAAISVDGTLDAGYGSAVAVQTLQTQFGDANPNNGSEMDAGYGVIDSGRLYLMLTGNIEANFNKLEIFIDSQPGGQSTFTAVAGNDNSSNMNGLKFDAGFTMDYYVIARNGFNGVNDTFDLNFASTSAFSQYFNLFGGTTQGSGNTGTGVNASPIGVGFNNSNTAGVTGGTGAANQAAAAAVTTGLELSIGLADLGYTGGPIRVMVGQNGGNHDYWSNQFLGGLGNVPSGNLGGDGFGNYIGGASGIDMTDPSYASGDQFFTVIPEPSTIGLVGVGLVGLLAIRRRKA